MENMDLIKQKYLGFGLTEDNVNFAIDGVIEGTRREIILESLTADYRGMSLALSSLLLEELYTANGGEFKKENRGGYLYGTLLIFIGLLGTVFLIGMIINNAWKFKFVSIAIIAALFGLIQGSKLLYKSFRGKYKDGDSPFENL